MQAPFHLCELPLLRERDCQDIDGIVKRNEEDARA